jgi:hypothetical protein
MPLVWRVSPGKIKTKGDKGAKKAKKGQKLFKNYLVGMMYG